MPNLPPEPGTEPRQTRAGYAALVGRPNAGKSTLMNALVGDKLSIVTPKAQTTWQRVTGIASSDSTQIVFLDTPGLLSASNLLQRAMLAASLEALADADVVVLVLDASYALDGTARAALATRMTDVSAPTLAAINKVDIASAPAIDELAAWAVDDLGAAPFPISARTGTGLVPLRAAIEAALPVSGFLYPEEDIASQPVRFFVSELIRETVFEQFREEVPYSVFAQVEEFRDQQDPVYIGATVFVERNSQKRIVVGDKGGAVKRLGQSAREKIEAFLGRAVYLDLWVKHLPDWRRKRSHLRRLGFKVPEDNELLTRS